MKMLDETTLTAERVRESLRDTRMHIGDLRDLRERVRRSLEADRSPDLGCSRPPA